MVSLDVRFLKHPEAGLYLELFTYRQPVGDQTIHRYWIDPWGVQWEMEQGRPVGRAMNGIVG